MNTKKSKSKPETVTNKRASGGRCASPCSAWVRTPVHISGKNVGWLELKPDAEKSLVKAAMGHKLNPTANLAIRADTMEIVEVDLCWAPRIAERQSDYQMLRDVMVGSQRLAGARFTEREADELCEMIRQRATLPSLPNS